jgi:hypothetical protein
MQKLTGGLKDIAAGNASKPQPPAAAGGASAAGEAAPAGEAPAGEEAGAAEGGGGGEGESPIQQLLKGLMETAQQVLQQLISKIGQ